jgi:DNA polymerase-3 subunit epsilon
VELARLGSAGRNEFARGIGTRMESTILAERAAHFLESGPADPVSLISHVCNLPGAPIIVAEHMAQSFLAGRPEFVRDDIGRWLLHASAPAYSPEIDMSDVDFDTALALARRPDPDVLSGLSYVVVDVETTGTRHYAGDRITEIAAVVVRDGRVTEVFETLVNPQRSIPPFVTQLTNITWEMVKDAPTFRKVESQLLDVMAGHVFVAHNANFDWRFISSEVRRASGRELIGRRLCTVKLARRLLPQLPRRSLDYVAGYYGVEISARHRAGGDAIATAHCLLRLLSDAADRGCLTWSDLDFMIGFRARMRRARRRRSALPHPVDKDTTA